MRALMFSASAGMLVCSCFAILPQAAAQQLPDLRTRPLAEAVDTLRARGFQDIRVARWHIDDLPAGRVFQQFPPPGPQGVIARLAAPPTIWLIVSADPLVLPDFTGWRADHALTRIRAQGLVGRMDGPVEVASQGEVIGQAPQPGLLDPLSPVGLGSQPVGLRVVPMSTDPAQVDTVEVIVERVDTVQVQVIDTVIGSEAVQVTIVDTVTIVEIDSIQVATAVTEHWRALLALGMGGMVLGTLGSMASARLRRPRLPGADPVEGLPPKGRPRGPTLPTFEAVIVDEEVFLRGGKVVAEGASPDAGPDPPLREAP